MHPIKTSSTPGRFALSALVLALLAGCDETARKTTAPANPGATNIASHVLAQPVAEAKDAPHALNRWNTSVAGSR